MKIGDFATRFFDEDDARNRVAAQVSREERKAIADVVIDNSGAMDALEAQVDAAWQWIQSLAEDRPAGDDLASEPERDPIEPVVAVGVAGPPKELEQVRGGPPDEHDLGGWPGR